MNSCDQGLPLQDDDCIEFFTNLAIRVEKFLSILSTTTGNFNQIIQDQFWSQDLKISERRYAGGGTYYYSQNFLGNGIPCELLKVNSSGWQKGKIKVRSSVEFYPDEPEAINEPPSPLDDIRQSMS
jgi:hypothetical protein